MTAGRGKKGRELGQAARPGLELGQGVVHADKQAGRRVSSVAGAAGARQGARHTARAGQRLAGAEQVCGMCG